MTRTAFILLLMEDEQAGDRLRELLRDEHGHSCNVVGDVAAALDSIRSRAPDLVVTPAQIGGVDAAGPLAELLGGLSRDSTLLVDGTEGLPKSGRIAVERLAPAETVEGLARSISRVAEQAVGRREDRLLQESIAGQAHEPFEGIVGTSSAIRRIIERIRKAARNKLTVLIAGETGTGRS